MNDAMEGTLPRHADWQAAAWLLEKGWPLEFAPYERRPIPVEPVAPKSVPDLSGSSLMRLSLGDGRYVDADEVMRLFSFQRRETEEVAAKTSPAKEVEYRYNPSTKSVEPIEPLPEDQSELDVHPRFNP
jgi:hypothetical protein